MLAVVLTAHRIIRKVRTTMHRFLSALVVVGAVGAAASAPHPAIAAAPIPEITAGAVPSLAPMLARITPGVVNIAVRAVRTEPAVAGPFFRRFNLPQNQQTGAKPSHRLRDVDAARVCPTNGHVVENATRIEVTTKDTPLPLLIGGRRYRHAVLIPTNNLPAVPMAI